MRKQKLEDAQIKDGKPLKNRKAIPLAEGQEAPATITLAVPQPLLGLTFQLTSQV